MRSPVAGKNAVLIALDYTERTQGPILWGMRILAGCEVALWTSWIEGGQTENSNDEMLSHPPLHYGHIRRAPS